MHFDGRESFIYCVITSCSTAFPSSSFFHHSTPYLFYLVSKDQQKQKTSHIQQGVIMVQSHRFVSEKLIVLVANLMHEK